MAGAAYVHVERTSQGDWEVSASPEDIFYEMYGADFLTAPSEIEAIALAREVKHEMSTTLPRGHGHPSDSTIWICRVQPPDVPGPPRGSYSIAMQDAVYKAVFAVQSRLGGPDAFERAADKVIYREMLKELRKAKAPKAVRDGAAWLVFSHFSRLEWIEGPRGKL